MRPRLLRTQYGEFAAVEWNGRNESGIAPFRDHVLILPEQAASTSSGGVYLPEDTKERMDMASEFGVIVAAGPEAFRSWGLTDTPRVGDRVWFERYAGSVHKGLDGRTYRLMTDSCIGARFDLGQMPAETPPEAA